MTTLLEIVLAWEACKALAERVIRRLATFLAR